METLNEILELLNPWWKEQSISKELAKPYKRKIFHKILKLMSYRQITILSGLRRIGKTTSIYQLIEHLLNSSINASYILYFNFDKKVNDLTEILDIYTEKTGIDWKKEKIFVFLDEISKLNDWANKLKLVYDAYPKLKFIISSSSSTNLEEEAIKNLGGRYFLISIRPLSFIEYLELKNKTKLLENHKLWEKEIKKEVKEYHIRTFPEIINWTDELLIKDYLRTTIIDKIIKLDLPDKFKNVNKDLLFTILEIVYNEPGLYLEYDGLSKKLHVAKKTLLEHFFYLEFSYLIRRIKNFRPAIFTSSRKLQRVYSYWGSLAYCYSKDEDRILENIIISILDAKYYWRKGGKEIDIIILDDKKIKPIEVKNKAELSKNDLKNMRYFLERYNVKEGIIIYNGKEATLTSNKSTIKLVPFWKWLLIELKEGKI